jgi:tetratricopeptide (TPR) repeat protein
MSTKSTQFIFSPQNSALHVLDETLTDDRRELADRLMRQIRAAAADGASHHNLLIGPRGSGKTHLLAYIGKSLVDDRDRNIHVITLAEEERGRTTLLDLLLAAFPKMDPPVTDAVDRIGYGDPVEATEKAKDLFDEKAAGRPVLILLENLSDLFAGFAEEDLREVRGFLQERPGVSLLATSITLFADSGSQDHPFHGFFQIGRLDALEEDETPGYVTRLVRVSGREELAAAVQQDDARPRLLTMHHLAGGNHRLLAMLSSFMSIDDFNQFVEPFLRMADRELTPYYQQRLDRLSPQQSKILRVIAEQDGRPVSVQEITRLAYAKSPQVVTRQLSDLVAESYVVRYQKGRESLYDLHEPLLRWILELKSNDDGLVRSIVTFLRSWFEADQLRDAAEHTEGQTRRYFEAALAEFESDKKPLSINRHERTAVGVGRSGEQIENLLAQIEYLIRKGEYEQALQEIDLALEETRTDGELLDKDLTALLFVRGATLYFLDRYEEAISTCDEVVSRYMESDIPALQEDVAIALCNKGVCLRALGRDNEAIAGCDELVLWYGKSNLPELQTPVARALVNKGVCLGELGCDEEAIAVYEEVEARYGESELAPLQEQLAVALFNKGVKLGELGRDEEAFTAYEEVEARFGDSDRPALQEQVAAALGNKGVCLKSIGRHEEAIETHDEVVVRYGESDLPMLQQQVARALFNKGVTLSELGRDEEALAAYDNMDARYGESAPPELQERVAKALFNKGVRLNALGRYEEAITAYDLLVARHEESNLPELQEPVAKALSNKGLCLESLGRYEEAITSLLDLISRFQQVVEPGVLQVVSRAFRLAISTSVYRAGIGSEPNVDTLGLLDQFIDWGSRRGNIDIQNDLSSASKAFFHVDHDSTPVMERVLEIAEGFPDALAAACIGWVQSLIPMTKEKAEALGGAEETLGRVFGDVDEMGHPLAVLRAVRRLALGDEHALLALPREVRSLVEAKTEEGRPRKTRKGTEGRIDLS